MSLKQASTSIDTTMIGTAPSPPTAMYFRGRWLFTARVVWVVVALLCVGLFSAGVPIVFTHLQTVCPHVACTDDRMTPDQIRHLLAQGLSVDVYAGYIVVWRTVSMLVWSAVGLVIFWRKSDNWMAWFAALFLVSTGATLGPEMVDALATAYPLWSLPVELVKTLSLICLFLFFCLFPDGQFVPRWTRWVVLIYPILLLSGTFFPGSFVDVRIWPLWLNWLILAPSFGLLVFSQVYRYRHTSDLQQRQQTKWVVFGTVVALGGLVGLILLGEVLTPSLAQPGSLSLLAILTAFTLGMLLIPLSIGAAVLRYRLWDIDPIINRTLVYSALMVGVVGMYVIVVGYLGLIFQTEGNFAISIVATGVVAVLFQPLRQRLQRGVNRLMYGERDEPYAVISRLGQRLESTLAPDAVLPAIVETVKEALKLPYAAITLKEEHEDFRIVAELGVPVADPLTLPLVYQGEMVGQLILSPRAKGETFNAADRHLLANLAHQVGVAVHAIRLHAQTVRLADDLQRSREHLVTAREEERRRLRRDLHDGIGPTLASFVQRLDAARLMVQRDPDSAVTLLGDLKSQVKATIADIRRLVYALRPPVLDEFGLVSAIREHAMSYNQSEGLRVLVEAPDVLPPLPAAVEVAAYRIALEALTNVAQHAQARTCHIRLEYTAPGALCLEITDDGQGLPEGSRAGVGLTAMRERAAELGGVCIVEPRAPQGTRVWVQLPCAQE